MEKISCGGFYIGDNLEITKDEFGRPVLNTTGGGSGGGDSQTVVKIMLTENPEGESANSLYIIESNLTTSEIEEAFKTSNVVAWVYMKNYYTDEWIKQYQLNCATCLNLGGDTMIVFTEIMNIGTGVNVFTLSVMGGEWNYSVIPIPLS